jgi:hypothetical protein
LKSISAPNVCESASMQARVAVTVFSEYSCFWPLVCAQMPREPLFVIVHRVTTYGVVPPL